MTLHEKLKQARLDCGLSINDVSKKCGIFLGVLDILCLEKGVREPTPAELSELAKIYGKPIEFFVEEKK
jgi:transcriptional regulator with XRE-family HTH domain